MIDWLFLIGLLVFVYFKPRPTIAQLLNDRMERIQQEKEKIKRSAFKGSKVVGDIIVELRGFREDALHLNRRKVETIIKGANGGLKIEPLWYRKLWRQIKDVPKFVKKHPKVAEVCLTGVILGIATYFLFGLPMPILLGTTKTWAATAAGNASSGSNWSPSGAPTTGDDIVFDSTSTYSCTWDLSGTFGLFSINSGYTGTITQSADFTVSSFSISSGTFTGSTSYLLTCSGNWAKTGGTVTNNVLRLRMTGDGTSLTGAWDDFGFYFLQVSGNITVDSGLTNPTATFSLTIDSGKTLTIASGRKFEVINQPPASGAFTNLGTIAGPGTMIFYWSYGSSTVTFGNIGAPVEIKITYAATASRTLTLGSDTTFGSTLNVYSTHSTYTITLDGGGYTLTVSGLTTLGDRGIMTQGTGTWTFNGELTISGASSQFTQGGDINCTSFTISNGTFTGSTSYWLTTTSGFTKTGGTITSWTVQWKVNGTQTFLTNAWVYLYSFHLYSGTLSISPSTVNGICVYYAANRMRMESGTELIIPSGKYFNDYAYSYGGCYYKGKVSGVGNYCFKSISSQTSHNMPNMAEGVWTISKIYISTDGTGTTKTITFTSSWTLTGTLILRSGTASTTTYDLAGYSFSFGALVIDTLAILKGSTSTITCKGSWTSTAGTFNAQKSTVVFNGTGTQTIQSSTAFNNVTIKNPGVSITANIKNLTVQAYKQVWQCAKWYQSGSTKNITITGLLADRKHNFTRNNSLIGYYQSDNNGVIKLTWANTSGAYIYRIWLIPYFMTEPQTEWQAGDWFCYTPIFSYPGYSFSISTNASWLHWDGHNLTGILPLNFSGAWINISTVGNITLYQNFTLTAKSDIPMWNTIIFLVLALAMSVFAFIERKYLFIAGIIWIIGGLTVMVEYADWILLICVGIGLVMILEGGLRLIESKSKF